LIDKRIAFLGAGNMANALIKGLLRAGVAANNIWATVRREERRVALMSEHGIRADSENRGASGWADVLILCVKPQAFDSLLREVAPVTRPETLVISIAAGVAIEAMERRFGTNARIIRAMPNTPSLIGAGATALAAGPHATTNDLKLATQIFDSVGLTVTLEEYQLDAVTGLSGSGPAYIFLILEALSDAGVKVGLSRHVALKLAAQTVYGSAKLLLETGAHPGQLKDQVTSPGGTAIAGLHTLEAGGLRTTLMDAVEAATLRAQQLGAAFLAKTKE
jgi:pyrroline-5-carboxylate reductase